MVSDKIIIRIIVATIFLFEWAIPVFLSDMLEGNNHLKILDLFEEEQLVLRIVALVVLVVPSIPLRIKKWAYIGFGINFISACVTHSW